MSILQFEHEEHRGTLLFVGLKKDPTAYWWNLDEPVGNLEDLPETDLVVLRATLNHLYRAVMDETLRREKKAVR